jgi:ribonuclease D
MADEDGAPLIASVSGLEDLVDHVRASGRLAFDTEFVSEETFEPVLCLIQVATRDRLAVVDPLAIGDITPFWDAINDPSIEVVMHAASEDLRICRLKTGTVPQRIFDVQIAAGLVGFGYPLSLGNLVGQALRATVSGGETRTDWRRRPLSSAQLRYALDDVRYLLDLADLFAAQLAEMNRTEWAEAEFARFVTEIANRAPEDRWRRLPGLHLLNRRGLELARRLSSWRYDEARRANRPLRQVLRDDLLVAIAKRQPANRRDLEALRDFNRPHLLHRASDILAVVADAQRVPVDELPEAAGRHEDGPGLTMVVNLLNAALAQCCAEHKVAASLVGSTHDLKELVRWHSQGCPEGHPPDLASGWRATVVGGPLLDVLSGRCALRVVDPQADVPVALEPLAHVRPEPADPLRAGNAP